MILQKTICVQGQVEKRLGECGRFRGRRWNSAGTNCRNKSDRRVRHKHPILALFFRLRRTSKRAFRLQMQKRKRIILLRGSDKKQSRQLLRQVIDVLSLNGHRPIIELGSCLFVAAFMVRCESSHS
jgi:hypothetical protein